MCFEVCVGVCVTQGGESDQLPLHLQSTACATANTLEDLLRFLPRIRGEEEARAAAETRSSRHIHAAVNRYNKFPPSKDERMSMGPDTETPDRRSIDC